MEVLLSTYITIYMIYLHDILYVVCYEAYFVGH